MPLVTLGQGLAFGLIITLLFHAILLPLGGWAPQVWDISAHEVFLGGVRAPALGLDDRDRPARHGEDAVRVSVHLGESQL